MANTKQFEFSDIRVIILGRQLEGFRGVSYTVSKEKELVYGRGNKALSLQSGNESIEGELMLLQNEVEALRLAVQTARPTAKLTDVSFDIVVTYGNGTSSVTDTLLGCEFTEYEKGMEQGDKFMEISMPFMALDIVSKTY